MTITQTAEQLAEILAGYDDVAVWNCSEEAAAMLRSQAAEIEMLKYNVDIWYERFMEAAKRCHELQASSDAWCEVEKKL
jgi:hypothetical protein